MISFLHALYGIVPFHPYDTVSYALVALSLFLYLCGLLPEADEVLFSFQLWLRSSVLAGPVITNIDSSGSDHEHLYV